MNLPPRVPCSLARPAPSRFRRRAALVAACLTLGLGIATACDDGSIVVVIDGGFLDGTGSDPQIGVVVHSTANLLRLFQIGDPDEAREIALGASTQVTPTGLAVRGERALVPLGNAASAAVIDLRRARIERFFVFPSGNATGSAWIDDDALLVANFGEDYVGRASLAQSSNQFGETVEVTLNPTEIVVRDDRAYVVSTNSFFDDDFVFQPQGEGIVTVLDTETLEVLGTIETGGTNATSAAFGPDGNLYVVNTGDFATIPGSIGVIDPQTMTRTGLIEDLPPGPGEMHVDATGLLYVSGFFFGTLVYDTNAEEWVRGPEDPLCAPLDSGGCRGAFDALSDRDGDVYQLFFGSPSQGLAPRIFVYDAGTLELADSIAVPAGPAAIDIRVFE